MASGSELVEQDQVVLGNGRKRPSAIQLEFSNLVLLQMGLIVRKKVVTYLKGLEAVFERFNSSRLVTNGLETDSQASLVYCPVKISCKVLKLTHEREIRWGSSTSHRLAEKTILW